MGDKIHLEPKIVFLRMLYKEEKLNNREHILNNRKETLDCLQSITKSLGRDEIYTCFDFKPWNDPIDSDVLSDVFERIISSGLVVNNIHYPCDLTKIGRRKISHIKRDYLPQLDQGIENALTYLKTVDKIEA